MHDTMKHISCLLSAILLLTACSADYDSADPSDDDILLMDYQVQADWNLRNCTEYKGMTPQEIDEQEEILNQATVQEINQLYTFTAVTRATAEGRLNAYILYLRDEAAQPPLSGSTCTFTLTRGSGTWIKTQHASF